MERDQAAAEAYRIISDDGMLLIYDIRLPSPANPNVCRIGKGELRALAPHPAAPQPLPIGGDQADNVTRQT